MNFTDKRITELEKRIATIERLNKDKSDQIMRKFENTSNYIGSIDMDIQKVVKEFEKRIAELEAKFADYILSGEKEQVAKVIKPIRKYKGAIGCYADDALTSIQKCLAIAEGILGGEK